MLSKYPAWDFVKEASGAISTPNLYMFSFPDEFISQSLSKKIKSDIFKSSPLRKVHAQDVTVDWIEENFKTLSLFATQDNFLIIQAQFLSKKVVDYLLESDFSLDDQFLILSFSGDTKVFDKLSKKLKEAVSIKIEAPKFWEGPQLLNFLADDMKVTLSGAQRQYLLANLENDSYNFHQALNLIKLYFEDSDSIDLERLKELVTPNKVDQFELAALFCKNQKKAFFSKLFQYGEDFDVLRSIFQFMQGHLVKIYDPSYMDKKPRLTKYDKEIKALSSGNRGEDLLREMKLFSELEIEAKSKNQFLKDRLKLLALEQA